MGIPLEWYRQMRQTNPVAYDPRFNGWNVFRYDDALYVLTNPAIFSSEPQQPWQPHLPSLLSIDPPRHRHLRNIVSQAFTPRVVAQLEPRITEITNRLLDAVIPNGEMDVIKDLAYPLPITIIAELLGVPAEDRAMFRDWSSNLVSVPSNPSDVKRLQQAAEGFNTYFTQKLEERRNYSRDDLMSRLVVVEVDGQYLSKEELLDFCRLLLIAGHETTANLIGNAAAWFHEYPAVVEELRNNPSLMPSALEEILRCYPSVIGAARATRASIDTILRGQHIGQREIVHVLIGSANYDEEQFPNPERFDIRREPNRHLSFGYGIHFCLGAPLARLEAKIALNLVLERLTDIQLISDQPVEPVESPFIVGVKRFPIRFKAAS
jgi:cytochrome P450